VTDQPTAPPPQLGSSDQEHARTNSPFHQPTRDAPTKTARTRIVGPTEHHQMTAPQRAKYERALADAAYRPQGRDPDTGEPYFLDERRDSGDPREPGRQDERDRDGDRPRVGEAPRHKIGDLELTEQDVKSLLERHALEESRKATLPSDPRGYKLELPADFVVPPGVEFTFNENDPRARLAREFALENGLSQAQFSKLIAIDAARQVEELAALNRAVDAEIKKLGATGTQRVTAIQQFLRGALGDDGATPFIKTLVSEKMVSGWERIMQRVSSQGVGSFSQSHRESDERSGPSDEAWSKMSYGERADYARAANGLTRRKQR
jgi:hypothetical protein